MKKKLIVFSILSLVFIAGISVVPRLYRRYYLSSDFGMYEEPEFDFSRYLDTSKPDENVDGGEGNLPSSLPESLDLNLPTHYYQTFNNCGPATLAMILNFYEVDVGQKELGDKLRPYQNPEGDNDDKTVFLEEMAREASSYGFSTFLRANGTIQKLKVFTSNDIPVVVKSWLEPHDDIGHFRIVTGYDDGGGYLIQDDSYQGHDRRFNYELFLKLWQPFGYQYLIIVPEEQVSFVQQLLGQEEDVKVAWENGLRRGEDEEAGQPGNPYPVFNQAVANYHLGNFEQTVKLYERVEENLPRRMLWYQLEPIDAYIRVGNYTRALELIENILSNGNRAYSELYILRGNIYLEQGNADAARGEFEQALYYNENSLLAKEALLRLQ